MNDKELNGNELNHNGLNENRDKQISFTYPIYGACASPFIRFRQYEVFCDTASRQATIRLDEMNNQCAEGGIRKYSVPDSVMTTFGMLADDLSPGALRDAGR